MPRDYRMPGNIALNSGFSSCEDRMALLAGESIPRRLGQASEIKELTKEMSCCDRKNSYVYVDMNGRDVKMNLDNFCNQYFKSGQMNADWDAEPDSEGYYGPDYILNKPSIFPEMDVDFICGLSVGGYTQGEMIPEGTPILEIIKRLLSGPQVSGVYYGTFKNPMIMLEQIVTSFEPHRIVDLLSKGWTHEFTANDQYYYMVIPVSTGLELEGAYQIDGEAADFMTGDVWKLEMESYTRDGCIFYRPVIPMCTNEPIRIHYKFKISKGA